uniref:Uncharacterized protein n=1 Tax=Cannabis sativa TaxID=3483 RepID=A0A803Q7K9_CANSA
MPFASSPIAELFIAPQSDFKYGLVKTNSYSQDGRAMQALAGSSLWSPISRVSFERGQPEIHMDIDLENVFKSPPSVDKKSKKRVTQTGEASGSTKEPKRTKTTANKKKSSNSLTIEPAKSQEFMYTRDSG